MVYQIVFSYIYLIVACVTFIAASAALTIAFIYRKRCFNFPTFVALNTILGVFIFSAIGIALCGYMIVWDQQQVPNIDYLCQFRAYLTHSTGGFIHHTFILQAVQRYLKVRRIHVFNNPIRKALLFVTQWIFSYTYILPVLLTGNMVKPKVDNLCFITLTKPYVIIPIAIASYFLTDVIVITLYRRLVNYIRQVSSIITANRRARIQRELILVRRIIMLNGMLVLVGSPVIACLILSLLPGNLLPYYCLRIILLLINLPMTYLVIVLCMQTPSLHQSFIECFKLVTNKMGITRNRIEPTTNATRF